MKRASAVFGVLGGALAAAAIVLCLTRRNASPMLLSVSPEAEACVNGLLAQLRAGDYGGASRYLYGTPELDVDVRAENAASRKLWAAFVGSLRCTPMGECYAAEDALAQNVMISGLNVAQVLSNMERTAPALLKKRVAQAQSMAEVYDDAHEYREDFVASVLSQATESCLRQAVRAYRNVTLRLVYDGQWWVQPDPAFLCAVSGGILGSS